MPRPPPPILAAVFSFLFLIPTIQLLDSQQANGTASSSVSDSSIVQMPTPPPPPIEVPRWPGSSWAQPSTTAMPARNYSASYLVIAPKIVRPGLPYAVSVNILRSVEPEHIVRVEIRDAQNATVAARVVGGVKAGMPQTVTIESLGEESLQPNEDYRVFVKAETVTSKTVFEDQARVQCSQKSVSIFVQTDKAIYKPGSTVHFRVLVLTPDLLPYAQPISVHIEDPNQNRISDWPRLQLEKGVHSGELALSAEPPLGSWVIHVRTRAGLKFTKEFSVDRYVLPKFEVTIRQPSFITINDDLDVQIAAKYTYGKGVAGKAKVRVELPFPRWNDFSGRTPRLDEGRLERSVKLNGMGEASIHFDNAEMRSRQLIMDYGGSTVRIVAEVQEELTELARNATAEVTVFEQDVKLEVDKQGETFKPGLPYAVVVALKQMDDGPAKSSLPRRVQLTIFYFYPSSSQEEKEIKVLELDAHGTAMLQLLPPINCSSARVEASYDREGRDNFTNSRIYTSLFVEAGRSPSQAFLQVNADNQGIVDAGKTLSFSVKSTEPMMASLTYQVVARGIVVLSEQIPMPSEAPQTSATLTFTATNQMAPKSRLVIYAIRAKNKEVLVDAIDFRVDGLFKNNVSLSVNRQMAEPGEPVKFTVKAAPDSFVGLLAVDQSVLLLKGGNDLGKELVEQDLEEYDTTSSGGRFWGEFAWRGRKRRQRKSIWYPWWGVGGKDASSIFENSGLVVLTDAFLYKEPEPQMMPLMAMPIMLEEHGQGIPGPPPGSIMFRQYKSSKQPAEAAPPIRQNFPETWIWAEPKTEFSSL